MPDFRIGVRRDCSGVCAASVVFQREVQRSGVPDKRPGGVVGSGVVGVDAAVLVEVQPLHDHLEKRVKAGALRRLATFAERQLIDSRP